MVETVERNENDIYEVGEHISLVRRDLHLSMDALADRMGTSRNVVYRHEHGQREMRLSYLTHYMDALHVNPLIILPERLCPGRPTPMQQKLLDETKDLSEDDMETILMMAVHLKRVRGLV